jgi:hypothetical protein
MLAYHASGERLGDYPWEDVSEYFIKAGEDKCIKTIRPGKREEA